MPHVEAGQGSLLPEFFDWLEFCLRRSAAFLLVLFFCSGCRLSLLDTQIVY